MAFGGRGGGGDELNAEINVTPMVDVMLVLLIIFMVTAPMLNSGVDITLPQINVNDAKTDDKNKLILSIDKQRRVFLGGKAVTWRQLETELRNSPNISATKGIWVEADATLPYSVVVTAMGIAKNAEIPAVQLVTDPSSQLNLLELDQPARP